MATSLTDLPEDILSIIFSCSLPRDFLATCSTCKVLYSYHQDALFWRTVTSKTFRLPISPLLKAHGARWYYLYKRLKTQTKLYTWGKGVNGNLGPGRSPLPQLSRGKTHRLGAVRETFQRTSSSWPTETHVPGEGKVIADLQCGGWSTTILSSDGHLYVVGIINAMDGRYVGQSTEHFQKLEYLTQSTSAIRQFSSGRRHILALTDDGEVLSWDRIDAKGLKVYSQHGQNFGGTPNRVVAGWDTSSVYVPETGIVLWEPLINDRDDEMLDGVHVKEVHIPSTARVRTADGPMLEVLRHIILDDFVVWITSESKLWACDIRNLFNAESRTESGWQFEVPGYSSPARKLQDIQGQFTKFAVFTECGEVLAGDSSYLHKCAEVAQRYPPSDDDHRIRAPPSTWQDLDALSQSKPPDVAALQHNQVMSLAFGDHHYHALHANGKVTSYGRDPQSVGAMGLGRIEEGACFRGLESPEAHMIWRDSSLIPQAEVRGRNIWFEPEKKDWLRWLEESITARPWASDLPDSDDTSTAHLLHWRHDRSKQFMFSEWIEQEGNHWDDGPLELDRQSQTSSTMGLSQDDFHLGSYFTITIAAAGWHSGALVLVDDDKVHDTRQKWLTTIPPQEDEDDAKGSHNMPGHFETGLNSPEEIYVWKLQGFPKVVLPNGYEILGDGHPRPWRSGMPSLSALGISQEA